MNSHEMGSHILMMKSPPFRAPNSAAQREIVGQTIITQVRAWQNTAVNSVQMDTCAGTMNVTSGHKPSSRPPLEARAALTHPGLLKHGSKSHLQYSMSARGCTSQLCTARTCGIVIA